MSQESGFVCHQESAPSLQDQCSLPIPPKKVAHRYVRTKIPSVTVRLPLSVRPPEPQKKPIDYVLTRLACMDFPGKGHVKDYLRHQYRRNFKLNTMRSTLAGCELFLSFLKAQGNSELGKITREDLEAFVEHELDRSVTIVTVKTRLCVVYAFLRFLHNKGVVKADLLVRRIRLRLPDPLPKAINPDDVKKLLSVLDDVRDRAMILVLLRTGMRIGELLSTRVDDVNLPERKIAIWQAEKNLMGRVVCVNDDAASALKAWLRKRDPDKAVLFYGQGRSSFTYQGARAVFVRYLKKAGLHHKGYLSLIHI